VGLSGKKYFDQLNAKGQKLENIGIFSYFYYIPKIHFSKICIRCDRKVLNSVILQDALKVAQHVFFFFKKYGNYDLKITAFCKEKSNNEDL
jgi:hypothetical protein